MGSINATILARKITENYREGKKKSYGKILKEVGYSESSSIQPSRILGTKAFKTAFELESRPIIEGLQAEINRIKNEIATRDLSDEEYRTLVGSLDIITKNHQLLSGGDKQKPKPVIDDDRKSKLLAILNDNA